MKLLNGFSLASAALGALSLSFGLSLVACGSDSSSSKDGGNKTPDGIDQFESMDDLVHCTKSHFGEIAYVTEKDSIYECTSEGWVVADSAKVEEILSSSDSKSDSDGKSSGSKDDSGDSDEKSSSSITASAEDTAKVETVKVDSVTVLGLAEKGPFTKGAVVNVYGLDSALNKSRTSFKGAVNDDKGNYSVSKIKLSSQYAMVEVNGFFNNEVTGKVTSGTKTKLRALVDLSEGDTVKANVNVLTNLEYERALALVKKDKYNVPAAKIRATREILAAFGVKADSVTATKLSLMGEGAATNGLLAASVAVIGNLSLSKFQARLGDVAESLAATGSIGDTLRAEIADDLSLLDSNGAMVDIMKNIKALNAKTTGVGDLLYAFWSNNYKLPSCDEKTEETIAKNDNKLSSYYGAGYACTSNRWHKSSALDTELGLCVAKNEGKYETTKAGKYYTCKVGQWREITKTQYELGACTEDIAKDAVKKYKAVGDEYFLCKDLQWEEITADEYELKDCGTDKNETVVAAKTSKVSYVCLDGTWRKATDVEAAAGFYCNASNAGKVVALDGSKYYCENGEWPKMTDVEKSIGLCRDSTAGKFDKVESQDYHCDGKAWAEITAQEAELGLCADSTSAKWKLSGAGDYYNCAANSWTEVTEYEYNLKKLCTTDSKGAVEKDDEKGYVCEADGWRQLDDVEYKFGYCEPSIKDSVIWTGVFVGALPDPDDLEGQFLVCNGSKWVDSKRADFLYGVCNESMQGAYKDANSIIYENPGDSSYKWPDGCEAVTLCKNMKRIYYGDRPDLAYAKCENGEWIPSSYADVYMFRKNETCTGADDDRRVAYSKEIFACFQGKWYETIKDSRDANVYRITKIGNQTWMAENLNFDLNGYLGTEKPMQSGCYGQGVESFTEEEVAANCSNRGRLYAWSVAMDSAGLVDPDGPGKGCGYYEKIDCPNGKIRGICPSGWHLPDSTELDTLWNAVGGKEVAGIYLKSTSVWTPGLYNKEGEDSFGFTVLPSGLQSKIISDLHYGRIDDLAAFWTSSDYSDTEAYHWFFSYNWDNTKYQNHDKRDWLSIRCVKD